MPKTTKTWQQISVDHIQHDQDIIMSFNPGTDLNSGFRDAFPDCIYLSSTNDFIDAAQDALLVASERYHGVIYALAIGTPAIGIGLRSKVVYSKISEIFRKVGYPQAFFNNPNKISRSNLTELADEMDMAGIQKKLKSARSDLLAWLRNAIEKAL